MRLSAPFFRLLASTCDSRYLCDDVWPSKADLFHQFPRGKLHIFQCRQFYVWFSEEFLTNIFTILKIMERFWVSDIEFRNSTKNSVTSAKNIFFKSKKRTKKIRFKATLFRKTMSGTLSIKLFAGTSFAKKNWLSRALFPYWLESLESPKCRGRKSIFCSNSFFSKTQQNRNSQQHISRHYFFVNTFFQLKIFDSFETSNDCKMAEKMSDNDFIHFYSYLLATQPAQFLSLRCGFPAIFFWKDFR